MAASGRNLFEIGREREGQHATPPAREVPDQWRRSELIRGNEQTQSGHPPHALCEESSAACDPQRWMSSVMSDNENPNGIAHDAK